MSDREHPFPLVHPIAIVVENKQQLQKRTNLEREILTRVMVSVRLGKESAAFGNKSAPSGPINRSLGEFLNDIEIMLQLGFGGEHEASAVECAAVCVQFEIQFPGLAGR